jgi:hypothetical protein
MIAHGAAVPHICRAVSRGERMGEKIPRELVRNSSAVVPVQNFRRLPTESDSVHFIVIDQSVISRSRLHDLERIDYDPAVLVCLHHNLLNHNRSQNARPNLQPPHPPPNPNNSILHSFHPLTIKNPLLTPNLPVIPRSTRPNCFMYPHSIMGEMEGHVSGSVCALGWD